MPSERPDPPLNLEQDYAIDTPENVSFAYDIAGVGNRFIAALYDTFVVSLALVLLNVLLFVVLDLTGDLIPGVLFGETPPSWLGGLAMALFFLLQFAVFWGYYTLFEFLWNGQTPGKRRVKIRVLRLDGNPIGFVEAVLRNLVRPIDFLPSGYGLGLVVMLLNDKTRRLGDLAAGTVVVRERADLSLDSLLSAGQSPRPLPAGRSASRDDPDLRLAFPHIRRVTAAEYELIQEVLARLRVSAVTDAAVISLARAIAQKLDVSAPANIYTSGQFLRTVAGAYRQVRTPTDG